MNALASSKQEAESSVYQFLSRRAVMLGGVSAIALFPSAGANASGQILVGIVLRAVLRAVATNSVRRGMVRMGAGVVSATASANASQASQPIVALGSLGSLLLRYPSRHAGRRALAERATLDLVSKEPFAARNPSSARRAAQVLDRVWETHDAYINLRVLLGSKVEKRMREAGDGSVMEATIGYFTLLGERDRDAAMAMWVDPDPDLSAWTHPVPAPIYRIRHLNDRSWMEDDPTNYGVTELKIAWKANLYDHTESWVLADIFMRWARTEMGWLVVGFQGSNYNHFRGHLSPDVFEPAY